jgi:prepilin-type processing-associated H-X9-DG protein
MDSYAQGPFQYGSEPVRFDQVSDGLSNTILAGEKHVPLGGWGAGGLDSSLYNGDGLTACTRGGGGGLGLAQSLSDPEWKFGSYHKGVCQFVYCDGSVQPLPSGLSPDILALLLCRNDGQVIPPF